MLVTLKLTSVYSWLSAVVTLNMQAPPSMLSCAALALRLFRSLPPMPITSQSSRRERAQLSQLSGGGIFHQWTPNAEYRGEPWVSTKWHHSWLPALPSWFSAVSIAIFFSIKIVNQTSTNIFSLYFPESPRHNSIPWWALFWNVEIRWTPSLKEEQYVILNAV